MKFSIWLLVVAALVAPVRGAAAEAATDLARADDARVVATLAADTAALDLTLADDLSYVHSSGASDTKESLLAALAGGKLKYLAFAYETRAFRTVSPGVALMSGRVRATTSRDGAKHDLYLSYLAVWRREDGGWRMVAWQSCGLPLKPAS